MYAENMIFIWAIEIAIDLQVGADSRESFDAQKSLPCATDFRANPCLMVRLGLLRENRVAWMAKGK